MVLNSATIAVAIELYTLVEVDMNPLNAITFAALCGPLAQPAAMAQAFIIQPAPVMSNTSQHSPSIEDFGRGLEAGREVLNKLTIAVDDFYLILIGMSSDHARQAVEHNGMDTTEACELFLRAFEEEVKATLSQNLPEFVAGELKSYWRHVAKARSSVTRLNDFAKSLKKVPETFHGTSDLDGLAALAKHTTEQLKILPLH